jgi:hypothetical protein
VVAIQNPGGTQSATLHTGIKRSIDAISTDEGCTESNPTANTSNRPHDIHSAAMRYFDIWCCDVTYKVISEGATEWEYIASVVMKGQQYTCHGVDLGQKNAKKAALRGLIKY